MATQALLRTVSTSVVIAGQTFPVLSWKATLANQGSMGTATASGTLSQLIDSGLDIIAQSQSIDGAEFDIYVGYDGESQLVFSGILDECEINWDDDTFEIRGRDYAALLADGKQTLAGLNYRNQSVAQIVKQIANQFGFAANITDPGIKAGPLMNGENHYNPQPRNYWNLLQSLAEDVGYECYMLPNQTLYFGPEQDQGDVIVNYGASLGSGAENPGWGLKVTYNPRNNSNIIVRALSLNSQTTDAIVASATAKPVALGKGRKTKSSLTGGNSKSKYSSQGSAGSNSRNKSIYYIRCPGMTPDQAQAACQAMANNLAKHQIIVEATIEGLPGLVLHSQVTLVQTNIDLYGFAGVNLNVSEVTHSFTTPSDGDVSGGYTTSFRALAQVENN